VKTGTLFLIPTPLGEADFKTIFPEIIKEVISKIDFYIVENEKSARRFIKQIYPEKNQADLTIFQLDKHDKTAYLNEFVQPLLNGKDMGLLSEAGLPAIADPGSLVVALAHQKNISVKPLVGPSSLMLALMGSGLNGQKFSFEGYLPKESSDLKKRLKHLEQLSLKNNCSKICIETPYRNNKLLQNFIKFLHPNTKLCIACDLTLPTEYIKTLTVKEWRKKQPDLHKRPTVFIFQA
jgi:16S rRNA (cytidine1402-2'-O)-methyltransferase